MVLVLVVCNDSCWFIVVYYYCSSLFIVIVIVVVYYCLSLGRYRVVSLDHLFSSNVHCLFLLFLLLLLVVCCYLFLLCLVVYCCLEPGSNGRHGHSPCDTCRSRRPDPPCPPYININCVVYCCYHRYCYRVVYCSCDDNNNQQ